MSPIFEEMFSLQIDIDVRKQIWMQVFTREISWEKDNKKTNVPGYKHQNFQHNRLREAKRLDLVEQGRVGIVSVRSGRSKDGDPCRFLGGISTYLGGSHHRRQ